MKKKQSTLRSQCRKELKIINALNKSGVAGTGALHVPKLWCFNELRFLDDREMQRESTSIMDPLGVVSVRAPLSSTLCIVVMTVGTHCGSCKFTNYGIERENECCSSICVCRFTHCMCNCTMLTGTDDEHVPCKLCAHLTVFNILLRPLTLTPYLNADWKRTPIPYLDTDRV